MARTRAPGSSKSTERFSSVPPSRIPRSSFDRSHSHKTTLSSGLLVPVFVDEILPGDTLNLSPTFFARMATPLRPFMDGIHLDWQFFWCPNRLVWSNWTKMMGERDNPDDHNDYTIPQMDAGAAGHLVEQLGDYLGCPILNPNQLTSALPHRMYTTIWNHWYRDENLQDTAVFPIDDTTSLKGDHFVRRRGKRKDYFSGALPFAQKGDPVSLPIGSSAPIIGDPATDQVPLFHADNDLAGAELPFFVSNSDDVRGGLGFSDLSKFAWGTTNAIADLTNAVSATINDMRVAISVQHLLERDARGGTRYREMVLAHFGVHTDDIRLLRPELLATGTMQVTPEQVPATNSAAAGEILGDLGAYATGVKIGRGFSKTFTEHGMVMGIVSIRAELSYQQGLPRWMSRKTRLDHYFPDLAALGEQAVLSQEIYSDGSGDVDLQTGDFSVWGYQPRYEEYRHAESKITGFFRSQQAAPLDIWHLGQHFATRPVLNEAYIEENPPIDRILTLTDDTEFLLDCYFKITHVRPMPRFGQPGLTRF